MFVRTSPSGKRSAACVPKVLTRAALRLPAGGLPKEPPSSLGCPKGAQLLALRLPGPGGAFYTLIPKEGPLRVSEARVVGGG